MVNNFSGKTKKTEGFMMFILVHFTYLIKIKQVRKYISGFLSFIEKSKIASQKKCIIYKYVYLGLVQLISISYLLTGQLRTAFQ